MPSAPRARDARLVTAGVLVRLCGLGATGEHHGGAAVAQTLGLLAAEQCARLLAVRPAPTHVHRVATALVCVDMQMRLYGPRDWCLELLIRHAPIDSVVLLSLVVARVVDGSRPWPTAQTIARCARWARANEERFRWTIAAPLLRSRAWREHERRVQLLACTEGCLSVCSFASAATRLMLERLRDAPDARALLPSVEARVAAHGAAPRLARCAAPLRRSMRIAAARSMVCVGLDHS
jgi:hypothetical protein